MTHHKQFISNMKKIYVLIFMVIMIFIVYYDTNVLWMLHFHMIESVRPIWCNNCRQCTPESPTLAEEVVAPEGHSHWPHTEHNALKLLSTTNLMHKGKVTKTTFQLTLADRETTHQKARLPDTLSHHAHFIGFLYAENCTISGIYIKYMKLL